MSSRHKIYFLTHVLITPALSASSFSPNCTFPQSAVNVVWSPDIRGTYQIFWSCMFTLIICSWTVQHPNVPKQPPPTRSTKSQWRSTFRNDCSIIVTRLKWMLLTLVIPEILVGKSFQDLVMARRSQRSREMQEFASRDGVEWTVTHAHYANIGGLVFRIQTAAFSQHSDNKSTLLSAITPPGEVRKMSGKVTKLMIGSDAYESIRAKTVLRTGMAIDSPPSFPRSKMEWDQDDPDYLPYCQSSVKAMQLHPNADQLLVLRAHGIIKRLPDISVDTIEDKSKGDALVKGLALMQVLWLMIQLAVRASQRLSITPLEITVLAFSICAVFTYLFSWSKPQGVNQPTYIDCADVVSERALADVLPAVQELSGCSLTRVSSVWLNGPLNRCILDAIPNDIEYDIKPTMWKKQVVFSYHFVALGFAGTVFGMIHCLAWNYHFPTSTEQLLWRISSSYVTAWVSLYVVNYTAYMRSRDTNAALPKMVAKTIEVILWWVYTVSRLGIMVLSFRSLYHLEPEAFISTPAMNFMHFQ